MNSSMISKLAALSLFIMSNNYFIAMGGGFIQNKGANFYVFS